MTTAVNYRLKKEDVSYIFTHAEVDAIIVDAEFESLLKDFRETQPRTPIIVDTDTDATEAGSNGPYTDAVLEGLQYDQLHGNKNWAGLEAQTHDEESVIALSYTSGTTAKPKGVEFTHRGVYLAALAHVIESGLNFHTGRCRFLWTLPIFHVAGA